MTHRANLRQRNVASEQTCDHVKLSNPVSPTPVPRDGGPTTMPMPMPTPVPMPMPRPRAPRATTPSAHRPVPSGPFTRIAVALAIAASLAASIAAVRVSDPSALAHAAPAAQAGTCTINGRLQLSGAGADDGIIVRAAAGANGTDGAETTTGPDGAFQLTGLSPGTVRLRASLPRHLSASADNVPCVADAVTTMETVELPGGDADNNDRVDLFDLVRILAHYRQCAGEADFDPTADLDDSGCIDLYDLVRVASNYRVTGPVPWPVDDVTKPGPDPVSFRDDILPMFVRDCRGCHGYVGGLNLDDYAHLMAGGNSGPVVVPGEPQASLLYLKVSRQVSPYMPPGGVRMSDEDIALIRDWIEGGAADN